jgi:hypothetical protein
MFVLASSGPMARSSSRWDGALTCELRPTTLAVICRSDVQITANVEAALSLAPKSQATTTGSWLIGLALRARDDGPR